jgi:hypothetical protein
MTKSTTDYVFVFTFVLILPVVMLSPSILERNHYRFSHLREDHVTTKK